MFQHRFFFAKTIAHLYTQFPAIFHQNDEDDEGATPADFNPLSKYGILPLIMSVVEITNLNFDEVTMMSICEMLYLANYHIDKNNYEQYLIKKWQRTH